VRKGSLGSCSIPTPLLAAQCSLEMAYQKTAGNTANMRCLALIFKARPYANIYYNFGRFF
jgi:hypothetical protein